MWVEQIVGNLLSNAVKYAPADRSIEVGVTPSPTEVAVTVTDHGPGIPSHEKERIFERFHRLGDHMTRSQGGAGLGLYIARQLALSIGGTLTVDSEPGSHTTFTLRVRAADRLVVVA
jgi:signal transduction histidine kinase